MGVHVAVTAAPLDAARLLADAVAPDDGAAVLFWGVVRNENDGRAVSHLEYHAYAGMAERQMRLIAEEAVARFGTGDIRVVHRVGSLAVGEASVAIVVAAPHRGEAYEASRYVIEELKRRVPVWKREGYLQGDSEWVPGFIPSAAAAVEGRPL
ncbi:MAG TPA: molybdenum cofactor biosynthesis protein MoaE [Longimicrobiaceae bacterium]|nr:molybdenum cofactor biosynthesis protein MoaE [Longimicrobiaceae bacterium]